MSARLLCSWNPPSKNTRVGCHLLVLSLGDLPDPGIEPMSPVLQADSLLSEPPGKPLLMFMHVYTLWYVCVYSVNARVSKLHLASMEVYTICGNRPIFITLSVSYMSLS